MDCSLIEEELCAYVDNELEDAERARIEGHLTACEVCVAEVAGFRAAKATISRLKLHEVDPPESLRLLPPEPDETADTPRVRWLTQPLRRRWVGLAAAAVFLGLLLSYRAYERQFLTHRAQRDVIAAHLQGTASLLLGDPGAAQTVAHRPIPRMGEGEVYPIRSGLTRLAGEPALHTIYLVGPHAISQLRLPAGTFRDDALDRAMINGHACRIAEVNGFSIASYQYGPAQIVLVTAGPPEALLLLARNIPPDTPFTPISTGY